MLTVRAANKSVAAIAGMLDCGFVRIYRSERPESANVPVADRDMLAELRFGEPAFSEPQDGCVKSKKIEPAEVEASGYARWFRLFDRNGWSVADGNVMQGTTVQKNCLTFNHTDFEKGDEISISSLVLTCDIGE